jgi:hypothetical protein
VKQLQDPLHTIQYGCAPLTNIMSKYCSFVDSSLVVVSISQHFHKVEVEFQRLHQTLNGLALSQKQCGIYWVLYTSGLSDPDWGRHAQVPCLNLGIQ